MNAGKGLRRLAAASALLSVFGGTSAWALSAPEAAPREPAVSYVQAASAASPGARPERRTKDLSLSERPRPPEPAKARPKTESEAALLAAIPHAIPITARPGGGRVIGEMPARSRYLGTEMKAWVLDRTAKRRFGKVTVPYGDSHATGWIRLKGLELTRTPYSVVADLSRHLVKVKRLGKVVMRFPAATGAPGSPSPTGRYFVTDRVAADPNGSFGAFAFGISGLQPNLPEGWTGGDQMAIHGTNDPGSIGRSVSAGCLRVSRRALDKLKPVLGLGTPVVIKP